MKTATATNGAYTSNGTSSPPDPSTFVKTHEEHIQSMQALPGLVNVPFACRLSFEPLIAFWKTKLDSEDFAERMMAREIANRVADTPELLEPIADLADLERHREIVELLLSGLFPPALRDTQLGKATKPFDLSAFYCTPGLSKMMCKHGVNIKVENSNALYFNTLLIRACAAILKSMYGQTLDLDLHIILTVECQKTGMLSHFKSELNLNFCKAVLLKPLKEPSQEHIHRLLGNIYDTDAWLSAFPPDHFELHGVVSVNLIDVTVEETLSRLRYHLLEKDAVLRPENIARLERLMKSYLRMPDLRLGIMAIDYPFENRRNEYRYKIRHCFLSDRHDCLLEPANANSVYEKAARFKETLLVEDLDALNFVTPIEEGLRGLGLRSYLVSPLVSKEGKVIGMFELGSPVPFQLNSFSELQIKEVAPLFSMAVERSREETDNLIEAVIREKFTAIHPSVEWRFVESAFSYLDRVDMEGKKAVIEPVAFDDVYPLYAQADIVSSSTTRNHSIQEDFLTNLQLICDLLALALKQTDFPLLHHYLLETEHRIADLEHEMRSSDESRTVEFIQREIHPLLDEMALKNPALARSINLYYAQLDPHFGIIYRKRKDYEYSVNRINSAISDYLEHEDERAQGMVSHYFEKYKTDGVQFELYAGQSILRNSKFSQVHLRNLRLWQLVVMCNVTRQMHQLKSELPMPLSTAQLVFVYGQPISVRFRMDDKRFDVDGAYNIRYEIIKKRIDKATVQDTEERLTQAGKIAIVYAAEKDRHEYMEYLNYLIRQGFIEEHIEDLELGHLQGVQGLRALRVTVVDGGR